MLNSLIRGSIVDVARIIASCASSRLRCLVFITVMVENAVSQRYVVENCSSLSTAFRLKELYWSCSFNQNSSSSDMQNKFSIVRSDVSSIDMIVEKNNLMNNKSI